MLQFTTTALGFLHNCFNATIPAYAAETLISEFLGDDVLELDLQEAREQAYAGLNADIGDYVKEVQIAFLSRQALALSRRIEELRR